MKRLSVSFFFLLLPISINAQQTDYSYIGVNSLSIAIQKNSVAEIDYGFKSGLHINLKHTFNADAFKYQSYILGTSYGRDLEKYGAYGCELRFSSDYKFSYKLFCARVNAFSPFLLKVIKLGASIMPVYDSELKYQTCYAVSASFRCSSTITVLSEFSRVPEYRIAYRRIYTGLEFKVKTLSVKPLIYIPIYDSKVQIEHSRIVLSMRYTFPQKKDR